MNNEIQIFNNPCELQQLADMEKGLKHTYLGVVYILEYGQFVKIGSTKKPYSRYMQLKNQAEGYGRMFVGKFAISSPHTNYADNEKYLHSMIRNERVDNTELYKMTFDSACSLLSSIDDRLLDETELIKKKAENVKEGFKQLLFSQNSPINRREEHKTTIEISGETAHAQHSSEVKGYLDNNGMVWLDAEDVAIGFGFTQIKNDVVFVRWERINQYLHEFGFSPLVGKGSYIPENMVYRLGFKANNTTAMNFQARLADEILPSIRKTGTYSIESLSRKDLALMIIQAEEEKERLMLENKQQSEQLVAQAPKVAFADAVVGSDGSCLIGELAKILTQNGYAIGQNTLFRWMRDNHYLGSAGERYNIPNQRYIEQGLFELKKTVHSEKDIMVSSVTPKVTPKGQMYFINKFLSNC